MQKDNVLRVPGRYDQIRTLCNFVADGGRVAGLDADTLFHVELCCDEASTNIIEHAYGGEDVGEICVRYQVTEDAFIVTLSDQGRAFDPNEIDEPSSPNQDAETALNGFLDDLQVGGLGIHFMRKLMDEVHYSFDSENGNTLTLVKYLKGGNRR